MQNTDSFFTDLETPRLFLKNIGNDDRDFIFKQFSDENVNKYLFDAEPMKDISEADDLISFYTNTEPPLQHRWILVEKATGTKLGTCGFHCWDKQEKSAEIGYDLQSNYWGNGFMSEAVTAIIAFAKANMAVKKIIAHIYTENEKSLRLAQKFGFVHNGKAVNYNFRGNDYLHHVYTLDL